MSDSVSFFCWLIGAGGIIGFVVAPREKSPRWSLGLAIAGFAFAGITRSGEGAIVFVELLAIALLSIFLFSEHLRNIRPCIHQEETQYAARELSNALKCRGPSAVVSAAPVRIDARVGPVAEICCLRANIPRGARLRSRRGRCLSKS
jgi:hypothetical protein